MTRLEAIRQIENRWSIMDYGESEALGEALDLAIESLSAEPSEQYKKGFEDAKRAFELEYARESLSTEPKWITDSKPTKSGTYMVTLDAFGLHRFVDILIYGKPIMPNRKVRGKCWYRSDDEWGDVVYDDEDILAWMPLPKPYGESEAEE